MLYASIVHDAALPSRLCQDPELIHCPVMKNQWDCVMNDLEELGGKEFLLKDRYNIEIFYCFLLLLPLCSSTFHQTNVEMAQDRSELDNRWKNNLLVQYRSKFFPNGYSFWVGVGFVRRPHFLVGGVHSVTTCPRGSGRAAGTAGDWRRIRRVGSWMDWRAQSRRVALTSCMDELSANTPTT